MKIVWAHDDWKYAISVYKFIVPVKIYLAYKVQLFSEQS